MANYLVVTHPDGGMVLSVKEVESSRDLFDAFFTYADKLARSLKDDELPDPEPGAFTASERRDDYARDLSGQLREGWLATARGISFSRLIRGELVSVHSTRQWPTAVEW